MVDCGVPTRFPWSVPSPRKGKDPPERHPLPRKKKLFTVSTHSESQQPIITVESTLESASSAPIDCRKTIEQMRQELTNLRQENTQLKRTVDELRRQQEMTSSHLFCLERFQSDVDNNFYTGLPNYATFMAIFNFLNPGEDGENIRPRNTLRDVPEDFYH